MFSTQVALIDAPDSRGGSERVELAKMRPKAFWPFCVEVPALNLVLGSVEEAALRVILYLIRRTAFFWSCAARVEDYCCCC